MGGPSIYDLLAQQEISDLTVANLNKATENTAIASRNVEFWSGIITVARALEESRTYAHGLPIPELGAVVANEIADTGNESFFATGTELWQIQNIAIPTGCTAFLRDSSSGKTTELTATSIRQGPIYLSATIGLLFINNSGGAATPFFGYYKVSL